MGIGDSQKPARLLAACTADGEPCSAGGTPLCALPTARGETAETLIHPAVMHVEYARGLGHIGNSNTAGSPSATFVSS